MQTVLDRVMAMRSIISRKKGHRSYISLNLDKLEMLSLSSFIFITFI
jgi:hypothetical protein